MYYLIYRALDEEPVARTSIACDPKLDTRDIVECMITQAKRNELSSLEEDMEYYFRSVSEGEYLAHYALGDLFDFGPTWLVFDETDTCVGYIGDAKDEEDAEQHIADALASKKLLGHRDSYKMRRTLIKVIKAVHGEVTRL